MSRALGLLHATVSWLLVATIPVSVLLRDAGAPAAWSDWPVGVCALAVVVTAVVAADARDRTLAFGLLLVYFAQATLSGEAQPPPLGAAFRDISTIALFALAAWYARRAVGRLASANRSLPDPTDAVWR